MAKNLAYAVEIKLAGDASTYTNASIGVTAGVMRLHTGRGNLTLNTNTYYPDLLTDIGTIENTVDFYELGGYRPFIQFEFGIFDAGLLSELKSNDAYLKNAEVTVFIGLNGSYTAECVGCIDGVSDLGDRILITIGDLTRVRDGQTDIFTVGNFEENARIDLEEIKEPISKLVFVGDSGDVDDPTDINSPKAVTPILDFDASFPWFAGGYESDVNITANPNYATYLAYIQDLFPNGECVVEIIGQDKPVMVLGAVSNASTYYVFIEYRQGVSELALNTLNAGQQITELGDFLRITKPEVIYKVSKDRALSFARLKGYADSNGDFDKTYQYGFKTRTGSKRGGRYNFEGDGRKIEFPQFTVENISMTNAVIFPSSIVSFPFNSIRFNTTVPSETPLFLMEIQQISSTVASNEIRFTISVDSDFFNEKGGAFTPKIAFKISNQTDTNKIIFDDTGAYSFQVYSQLEYKVGLSNLTYLWSSGSGTFYREQFIGSPDQYLVLAGSEVDGNLTPDRNKNLVDFDATFQTDSKVLDAAGKIYFDFTIPVTNDGSSFDIGEFGLLFFGIESEYGNVKEIPATINGELWSNDLNAPSGVTGNPENQTEVARYLLDIYGGYTPSTDYVSDVYTSSWAEKAHIQGSGGVKLSSELNQVYLNTYGLLTSIHNGKRRLIDLRGLSETSYSSVVRNFTAIEINNFKVEDSPIEKIYNSFKVNYCKNFVTGENEFYCNAIVSPDYSGLEIKTNQTEENETVFNSNAESLAELLQYSANLYNFINVLEIDVPSLDFRDGDAVTRFIYEIAKITAFRRREYSFIISYDDYASDRVYVGDKIALTNFVRTANNTVYGMVTHVGIDAYNSGAVEIQFSSLQIDRPVSSVLDEQTAYSVTIINEQDGSTTTIDEA